MSTKKEIKCFLFIVLFLDFLIGITCKFFYKVYNAGVITLVMSLVPAFIAILLEKDFKLKDLSKDKFSVIYSLYFILFIFFYILSFFSEKVLNKIDYVVYLGWLISLYVLTIDDKRLRGKFNFALLLKWALVVIVLDMIRLGILNFYFQSEVDFTDLLNRLAGALTLGLISTTFNLIFTMGEEYGWRYFSQARLQSLYGNRIGVLLTGLMWGLAHFPLYCLVFYSGTEGIYAGIEITVFCIAIGIVLGLIYMESRSVIMVTFIHLLHNMFMTHFTSAEYNQDFIFTKEFLLVSVIINIVLYTPFLLNKKYK
ncbi:CPBP family intramembrane glutamic endopeptidase [Peptoniphilus vaginalis]|uniref:CPBP family intramembrane glutamic endopeptidase n=1 Tax=Peptoniphilus vaginalis TaxID=1756987 RepID=UPI0023F78411|nr:CPBP family intramembrane glutamic endopeptidase [Peptoniphilus vaginalis]